MPKAVALSPELKWYGKRWQRLHDTARLPKGPQPFAARKGPREHHPVSNCPPRPPANQPGCSTVVAKPGVARAVRAKEPGADVGPEVLVLASAALC